MSDDLEKIPPQQNEEQEKLLDYIHENMSDEDRHEFEKSNDQDDFLNDAVEGLEGFKSKERLKILVQQMNIDLKKQVSKNKSRKDKRTFRDQPWIYYTIILLLLLIIISYMVIKKMNQG